MRRALPPARSLATLYPPRTVLAPRSTLERTHWLRFPAWRLDALTGVTISCMGTMPLICHEGVATEEILAFQEAAGIERPRELRLYRTEAEAIALARNSVANGERLASFYPPPPGADTPEGLLVSNERYGFFNNKSRLGDFVAAEHLPPRRLVPASEIATLRDRPERLPVYLKAAVEGASGSGKDLRYCAGLDEWSAAIDWFVGERAHLTGLIVEEAIAIVASWCLNFSVLTEESIYLGAAEQVLSAPGLQEGSRVDSRRAPPRHIVDAATVPAERARRLGYLGVCGFDVGIDSEGRAFVFDLNFRVNASTPHVLLHEAAEARSGRPVSQSFGSLVGGPLPDALRRLQSFVDRDRFLPLRVFDGARGADAGDPSFVSGLLLADSAEDARSLKAELTANLRAPEAGTRLPASRESR